MTLQQNRTLRTDPEKTDANLKAITGEIVIATEARRQTPQPSALVAIATTRGSTLLTRRARL
jgi:hypothetical protein